MYATDVPSPNPLNSGTANVKGCEILENPAIKHAKISIPLLVKDEINVCKNVCSMRLFTKPWVIKEISVIPTGFILMTVTVPIIIPIIRIPSRIIINVFI